MSEVVLFAGAVKGLDLKFELRVDKRIPSDGENATVAIVFGARSDAPLTSSRSEFLQADSLAFVKAFTRRAQAIPQFADPEVVNGAVEMCMQVQRKLKAPDALSWTPQINLGDLDAVITFKLSSGAKVKFQQELNTHGMDLSATMRGLVAFYTDKLRKGEIQLDDETLVRASRKTSSAVYWNKRAMDSAEQFIVKYRRVTGVDDELDSYIKGRVLSKRNKVPLEDSDDGEEHYFDSGYQLIKHHGDALKPSFWSSLLLEFDKSKVWDTRIHEALKQDIKAIIDALKMYWLFYQPEVSGTTPEQS